MLFVKKKGKNVKIVSKIVLRKNIFSQGTGLMFHKKIEDEAHIFIFKKLRRIAITMVFVFFELDAVLIDENKKIVKILYNMKPWREYYPKEKCMYFVELIGGTAKKKSLKIGEKLDF